MHIQFNTSNAITGDEDVRARIESAVRGRLDRFQDRLTRIELHLSDVNGPRGGPDDKECRLEGRPEGMAPITVQHRAPTVDLAAQGAADKFTTAFEREIGRRTTRKGH